MNLREETRSKLYWQILGLISIALLAYMLHPFLDVIIYGIFIYYVARPMYSEFERRVKHKSMSAFISLFIVVLPIVLISIYTLSIAYIELSKFLTQVEFGYMGYVNELFKNFKGFAANIKQGDISTLFSQGDTWGLILTLITSFSGIFSQFFAILFRLFLTFTIAFYLLKDGTKLREWITDTFLGGKPELTKKFFDEVDSDFHTVYFGNILIAVLTALIAAVIFNLLNLVAPPQLLIPYPILLGILCGLGIFIPMIGMKLIWVPLAIYLAIQAYLNGILFTDWWFILLFLVVVFVVVDFAPDIALRPYISGKHVHGGAMLLAYIFGIVVFGFVGLFLGPMILIIATNFMKIVLPELRGQSRGLQKRILEDLEVPPPNNRNLSIYPPLFKSPEVNKMKKPKIYDNYPLRTVILANIFMLAVYVAGAYILFALSLITGILYVAYLVLLELYFLKEGCIHCCYYGKLCAFGKGAVAALLFEKGAPEKFCERELDFKDFIPQVLVVLIPLIVGIALLISRGFNLLILIAMIYPVFSWFAVNPFLYGKLACLHCKQGSICCPALKFFIKEKGG